MTKNEIDLAQIFGQYTGQTLLDKNDMSCNMDQVMDDIRSTASQHNLDVRLTYPDQIFTLDTNPNIVRVHVRGDDAGKLKIARFTRG